jgi:hypothetical protein
MLQIQFLFNRTVQNNLLYNIYIIDIYSKIYKIKLDKTILLFITL